MRSVFAAQGKGVFPRLALFEMRAPFVNHARKMVRVNHLVPAPALHLLQRRAGVFIPAFIIKENAAVRVCHPRQGSDIVGHAPEVGLALAQLPLGDDALRDIFRRDQNAADFAIGRVPGPDFPFAPLRRAVRPREGILIGVQNLSGQPAPMRCLPAFGNFGTKLVVGAAQNVSAELVILHPPAAHGQIAHLTVEHGNRRRRVLDEQPQPLFALPQRLFRFLPLLFRSLSLGNLAHNVDEPDFFSQAERLGADFDRKVLSILAQMKGFPARAVVGQRSLHVRSGGRTGLRGAKVVQIFCPQFSGRIAIESFGKRVRQDEIEVFVEQ